MIEFENGTFNGIYYTRFIASWIKKGGKLEKGCDIANFRRWLVSLGIDDMTISSIIFLATNGKLELESSAERFLKEINK